MDVQPKQKYLNVFLNKFWYVPSDVLIRATEKALWEAVDYKHSILDIGTADGRISSVLFPKNLIIDVGLEPVESLAKKADKQKVYKKVVAGSAVKMPFSSNSFRTVVSNSTFEHISQDIPAVSEVSRVLKKGGLFYLTVPSKRFRAQLADINIKGRKLKEFNERMQHYHYRSFENWEHIMESAGLRVVEHKYYFSKEVLKAWYVLLRVSTFKPYRRELWSYFSDTRFRKFVPKRFIISLEKNFLSKYYKKTFNKHGSWLFIKAEKI
jgi:ubiquinone/menaquinone biosynthesis C-methylase UbiE